MGAWLDLWRRLKKGDFHWQEFRSFWHRTDLSITEKGLLVLMRSYANLAGQAWPTLPQIAKASGLHIETVERHLAALKAKKELAWQEFRDDHGHRRHLYQLPNFRPNPRGQNTPMALGGKIPPLTVTIVNKRMFTVPAWCRESEVNPNGCNQRAP